MAQDYISNRDKQSREAMAYEKTKKKFWNKTTSLKFFFIFFEAFVFFIFFNFNHSKNKNKNKNFKRKKPLEIVI
jgi:hypothetical protein